VKKLIIGKSSQLSYYYPNDIVKISARETISESVYNENWDIVYLFFAEQRTSYSMNKDYKNLFYSINFDLTLEILKKIKSKKIIFLSTSELWNLCEGPISVNTDWNYTENYYTDSKSKITKKILEFDDRVTVFFPFNYNSIHRKESFLFYKVYKSILNKEKIFVGDLNIDRELMHASFVSKEIERKNFNDLIGTGNLINIRKFISELYRINNLNCIDFVEESQDTNLVKKQNTFFCATKINYSFEDTLRDYNNDI
jgi:nucleoside-diphosphate-sugar epimerase